MNSKVSMINPTQPLTNNESVAMIATAKNFLTAEECNKLIALTGKTDFVKGEAKSDNGVTSIRNSKVIFMKPDPDNMWLFERLEAAMNHLNGAYKYDLLGFYEGVQIASYSNAGKYDWHIDLGRGASTSRKLSMSIQLSDPDTYEGGELEFGNVDQQTDRAIGTLIVFPSFLQHRVTPITSGTRHSCVAWVHGEPFR